MVLGQSKDRVIVEGFVVCYFWCKLFELDFLGFIDVDVFVVSFDLDIFCLVFFYVIQCVIVQFCFVFYLIFVFSYFFCIRIINIKFIFICGNENSIIWYFVDIFYVVRVQGVCFKIWGKVEIGMIFCIYMVQIGFFCGYL